MQITARAEYAIQAMAQLAASDGEPLSKSAISAAQRIPDKFLELILSQLRRAGFLASRRGAGGGYVLSVPAERISLADVVRVVDGPLALIRGLPPESTEYAAPAGDLRVVWVAMRAAVRLVLESVTLEALVSGRFPASVSSLLQDPGAWLVSSESPGLRRGEAGQSAGGAHPFREADEDG